LSSGPDAEQTTVGFELGFARAAQSDPALLPLQVGPAANQARRQMFELSQFDLQLALALCARWAKMSRIRLVRSMTRHCSGAPGCAPARRSSS
jgi:hypothetical protein